MLQLMGVQPALQVLKSGSIIGKLLVMFMCSLIDQRDIEGVFRDIDT
jgi:hypothetical protein